MISQEKSVVNEVLTIFLYLVKKVQNRVVFQILYANIFVDVGRLSDGYKKAEAVNAQAFTTSAAYYRLSLMALTFSRSG